MKIVYIAAGLYHHIYEITDALYAKYQNDFMFFATDKNPRKSVEIMGHSQSVKNKPYYKNINDSITVKHEALYWCKNAEIAIIGCGDCDDFLIERLKTNKLTFKTKERLFKYGLSLNKKKLLSEEIEKYYLPYFNNNLYYLCMGHYCSHDLKCIGVSTNKMLKWGYFVYGNASKPPIIKGPTFSFCWAGRYIKEKSPELGLMLFDYMTKKGCSAFLTYVGYGPLENDLKKKTFELGLENRIKFEGPLPEYNVRKIMKENNYFLITSSSWEGWGVVLSEAMSEGRICIASTQAGASLELIKNGANGFVFSSNCESSLYRVADRIMQLSDKEMEGISQNAYETMNGEWSPQNGADCLCEIFDNYFKFGCVQPKEQGLCSISTIEEYDE